MNFIWSLFWYLSPKRTPGDSTGGGVKKKCGFRDAFFLVTHIFDNMYVLADFFSRIWDFAKNRGVEIVIWFESSENQYAPFQNRYFTPKPRTVMAETLKNR